MGKFLGKMKGECLESKWGGGSKRVGFLESAADS